MFLHSLTEPSPAFDFATMVRERCRVRIRNVRPRAAPLVERVAGFLAERVGPDVGQGITHDEIARAFPGEPVDEALTKQAFALASTRAVKLRG